MALERQYEAEKYWHRRLMGESDPSSRLSLYYQAYAEVSAMAKARLGTESARGFGLGNRSLLSPTLRGREVLEIGCGYGFAMEAFAPLVKWIVGTDVVPKMLETASERLHSKGILNFDVACQPAQQIEFPPASFDVVFADNVWEHLHPDDAAECARRTYRVLRPRGHLIVITVNGRCGPFDISRYFKPRGSVADGLHLFEWGYAELREQLKSCGFPRLTSFVLPGSRVLAKCGLVAVSSRMPVDVNYKVALESSFLTRSRFLSKALGIQSVVVVAQKA
jgi:2-polyprenyl-3-methyl-5-hydroxy-6-metoxy-1,4-benzoquinol methylase